MPALLIDTYSLFFRAFHALPDMNTSTGEPTSAVYGFTSVLLKLLREQRGAELAFALDAPQRTFRHEAYAGYKAQRAPQPSKLATQFARLDELLELLQGSVHRVPGFEADDVLATLARRWRERSAVAWVVSGDRDLLQVARGSVEVLFVGRRGQPPTRYDEAKLMARVGVPPERLPAYTALVGDASDNLPGVAGIGPATARSLLATHANLEQLLMSLEDLSSAKLRDVLDAHREQLLRVERLARLRDDVPLSGDLARRPGTEALLGVRRWLAELEFRSLLPRLDALLATEGRAGE